MRHWRNAGLVAGFIAITTILPAAATLCAKVQTKLGVNADAAELIALFVYCGAMFGAAVLTMELWKGKE